MKFERFGASRSTRDRSRDRIHVIKKLTKSEKPINLYA